MLLFPQPIDSDMLNLNNPTEQGSIRARVQEELNQRLSQLTKPGQTSPGSSLLALWPSTEAVSPKHSFPPSASSKQRLSRGWILRTTAGSLGRRL